MNILKLVAVNTLSQTVARIISSATGFFIALFVARSFGIVGYSDLAKITALVTLFYLAIDLGANAIFLQFEKSEQKIQDLLSFRLLLAGAVFLLVVLLTYLLPYSSTTAIGYSPFVKVGIILFSLSFFTRAIVFSTTALFQKKFTYHLAALANVTGSFTTLGIVIFIALNHWSVLWIIGGYIMGGLLEASLTLFFTRNEISYTLPSVQFLKKIFFATLPLTILLFLNLLYFRVDMILLSVFQKSAAVGIYDFAYKFFDFLIALPLFLSNSLYPKLLEQEKNSRIQIKNISLYTILFFGLGLLLIPFVWFLSPLLVLVKHDFAPSVLALQILSLSLPIFFATNILQWIYITRKKQNILIAVYGLSLLLNIVLNILFIPQYSYIASAIITGLSEALILLVMIFLVFLKQL